MPTLSIAELDGALTEKVREDVPTLEGLALLVGPTSTVHIVIGDYHFPQAKVAISPLTLSAAAELMKEKFR